MFATFWFLKKKYEEAEVVKRVLMFITIVEFAEEGQSGRGY